MARCPSLGGGRQDGSPPPPPSPAAPLSSTMACTCRESRGGCRMWPCLASSALVTLDSLSWVSSLSPVQDVQGMRISERGKPASRYQSEPWVASTRARLRSTEIRREFAGSIQEMTESAGRPGSQAWKANRWKLREGLASQSRSRQRKGSESPQCSHTGPGCHRPSS